MSFATALFAVQTAQAQTAPTPNAGADQADVIEGATVTLSGSATGGSGTITYAWTQVDADSTSASAVTSNAISLTNANTATATFTAPEQTTSSTYYFRLTATASSMSASDIVAITVTDDDPPTVSIRIVSGMARTREGVSVGDVAIYMQATITNPDGDSVSNVVWSATPASPALTLLAFGSGRRELDIGTPELTVVQRGIVYTVRAAVTDSVGNEGVGTFEITVLDDDGRPTANAGNDQTVGVGQMVTLSGSATNTGGVNDDDVTYEWTQHERASFSRMLTSSDADYVALTNANTATVTFTAPTTPTTLHFVLTVTDTLNGRGIVDRVAVTAAFDPGIAVSVDNANVSEGGSATFTVALTGTTPATPVTVDWAISGAGITDSDYTLSGADTDGTLRFTATGSQTITASIADDALAEAAEPLTFTLSNLSGGGSGAGINTATASTTIAASDRTLTVTGPATIAETNADAESGNYTITLTGPAFPSNPDAFGGGTTVTWTVSHDATGGTTDADFVAASDLSGTVRFFPDEDHGTARTFTLTIAGDQLGELDEGFTVQVSVADPTLGGGTTYGDPAATTIPANDRTLTITGPASLTETNADIESGNYTITLTGPAFTADTTVTWSVSHNATGGTADADFAAASDRSGTVTFGASDSHGATRTFTLTIAGDQLNEGAEGFTVQASVADPAADGGTAYGDPAATTIAASDPLTASIAADATMVSEGGSATFTVTLSGASAGSAADIRVPYTAALSGDTGIALTDANSGSLTIAAGMTSGAITIGLSASAALDETSPGQTLTVTLTGDDATTPATDEGPTAAAGGGEVARSSSASEQSAQTAVSFLANLHSIEVTGPATIAETDSDGNTAYTVAHTGSRDILSGQDLVITWTVTAGGVAAADFTGGSLPGGTLTFSSADSTDQSITIGIAGDGLNEPSEAFTLAFSIAAGNQNAVDMNGGVALPSALTITIEDDDPVTVAITRASGSGAVAEDIGDLSFTVTLAGGARASGVSTIIPFRFSGLEDGEFDITSPSGIAASETGGSVTIAQADSTATITVNLVDNSVNEPQQTLVLAAAAAGESGLRLSGAGAGALEYTSGGDMVSVPVDDDDDITITLTRATGESGAVIEGSSAGFTISLTRTDGGSGAVTSAAAICVNLSVAVANQQTPANDANSGADIAGLADCAGDPVTLAVANGAGMGGVNIAAGQSSATLRIATRFDSIDEGSADETLQVTLSGAMPGAGAGTVTRATGAMGMASVPIQNVNSLRTLAVSGPAEAVNEDSVTGQGETVPAVFTITLSGSVPPASPVEVGWSLNLGDDGAITAPGSSGLGRSVEASDVSSAQRGSVTFAAAALPQTRMVTVDVQQDAMNEGAETLRLTLDSVPDDAGGQPNPMVPGTRVVTGSADATVAASDDITVFLTADTTENIVTSGQDARYTLSFGTTRVNGQVVQIVPTTQITVPLTVTVGGTAVTVPDVVVQPGAASAPVVILAAAIDAENRGGMLEVAAQTPTGAPGGATVRVASPADVTEEENRGQTVSVTPPARQVAGWTVAVSQPSSDAPEGLVWRAIITVRGAPEQLGLGDDSLQLHWSLEGRSIGGAEAAVPADFSGSGNIPPSYTCNENARGVCTTYPVGTVIFDREITEPVMDAHAIEILIRDNDGSEGNDPQGFRFTLNRITGMPAARTLLIGSASLDAAIPALRANLSVADAVGAEGANAEFVLTLSGFSGGSATTQPITVAYALADGPAVGGARSGADFRPPTTPAGVTCPAGSICTQIPMGAEEGATHRISVPLLQDGVLEPRETFTLTITGVEGGGGTIRLVADPGAANPTPVTQLTTTGTITDDADQAARRRQRVSALVTVLDRQTAQLATDAITERLARPRAPGAQTAQLSIANRNLLGRRGAAAAGAANAAGAAGGGGAPNLGLALYGASGLGGTPGLQGGASAAAGRSASSRAAAGANAGAAFGGLGAGLAGAANMGTRTALPSLAQVLNGSSFRFGAVSDVLAGFANFADGIEVWGSGGYVDLRSGNSQGGLEYDGESIAAFIGADAPVPALPNLTTGLALGWSAGDLDFTDTAGGFSMNGELSNDSLSLHPYLGWQISPHTNAWLVLGIGFGGLDIEEREGSGAPRKLGGGDTQMLMVSTGIAGTQQIGETGDLKLRFALTHVHSRVDSGSFDDGALLPKTRGRSLRLGGEAEAGRRIALENGLSLRPFGTLRVRVDNASTEAGVQNAALDWGAGISAAWSDLGLDGRLAFRRQLNDTGDEEQGVSLDLSFAPGASGQGIAIALQTALQQRRAGLSSLNASSSAPFASSGGALGSVLGASTFANAFGSGARTGTGAGMQHSLSGEIAYGVPLRYAGTGPGRAALLTPYGRFDFANANTRWAAGLRLAESGGGLQLGLEAGLDLNSSSAAAPARSYDLLLTGRLRF